MKKPPSKLEQRYTSVLSFLLALPICAAIWVSMKIVWPILRFCAKAALKQLRKGMTRTKVVKSVAQLPTPEIFKGAPNLAPARQIRF